MQEFINGTDEQFNMLAMSLEDNKCHVYNNCNFPGIITSSNFRLGFEKNLDNEYIVYIDKGLSTQINHEPLKLLLENGEIKFRYFDDVINFFRAFKAGYSDVQNNEGDSQICDKELIKSTIDSKQFDFNPSDISGPLKKEIFGQDEAIEQLALKVSINKMSKTPHVLPIILLGPTATGKSETAKQLAGVLSDVTGKHHDCKEIAASEFIGEHSVHRFFGAPPGYIGHGTPTLLDCVRKNPYHVIVLNEIEKADNKVLTGLMEAIDTGKLEMADNSDPINLNNCILLFTSNLPIDMNSYRNKTSFEREELCRNIFTQHCKRPEISSKIGNFIAFDNLKDEAIIDIIIKFVKSELDEYNLKLGSIDENLMVDLISNRTNYGARGIRSLIKTSIGQYLINNKQTIKDLDSCTVNVKGGINEIYIEKA